MPSDLERLLTESVPPKPAKVDEADREAAAIAWMDDHLGPGDEALASILFNIANGTAATRGVDRYGNDVLKVPSFADQIAAAAELRTWHRGRATTKVEVTTKVDHSDKWDPENLTIEELRTLSELKRKATAPKLAPGAIEGTFTEDDEP